MEPMNLGSPVGSPPLGQSPAFGMSPMAQTQLAPNVGTANSNITASTSGIGFLPGY